MPEQAGRSENGSALPLPWSLKRGASVRGRHRRPCADSDAPDPFRPAEDLSAADGRCRLKIFQKYFEGRRIFFSVN